MAISSEYPDVELSHMYVDNAAMQLVRNPKQVCKVKQYNFFLTILLMFKELLLRLWKQKFRVFQ